MSTASELNLAVDTAESLLAEYAGVNLDDIIPKLARDVRAMRRIEAAIQDRATSHELVLGDAREASAQPERSIRLVVTSPPYWTLKRHNDHEVKMGHVADERGENGA